MVLLVMYVNSLPFSFNVCILFHEPWFIYHGSIYFYFGYHPICFLYSEPDRVVFPALSCRYGINLPLFCSYLAILICSFCRQQFVVQQCGKTLKRRHWNVGTKSEKIVWQCNSYIRGVKNCSAKAVDDLTLKRAFIQLYNEMVVDKGSFFKVFLENINKVISKESKVSEINKATESIGLLEQDLSELVQLKLRKQIEDKYYNKEYERITLELEKVSAKKDRLEMQHLDDVKYKDKLSAISKIVDNGDEPLTEFDDDLFVALIDKVIIKSPNHFIFILESGQEYEADYSSTQQTTHVETVVLLYRK